jgi:hypothetical protein
MLKGMITYRKTEKYKLYRKEYMKKYRKKQREELLSLRKQINRER